MFAHSDIQSELIQLVFISFRHTKQIQNGWNKSESTNKPENNIGYLSVPITVAEKLRG